MNPSGTLSETFHDPFFWLVMGVAIIGLGIVYFLAWRDLKSNSEHYKDW
jgi:hypothetical protein